MKWQHLEQQQSVLMNRDPANVGNEVPTFKADLSTCPATIMVA